MLSNADRILTSLEEVRINSELFFSVAENAHEQGRFTEAQAHYKQLEKLLASIEQMLVSEGIQHIPCDPQQQKQQLQAFSSASSLTSTTSFSELEDNRTLVRNARMCMDKLEKLVSEV